jgi:hypothetical protein
MLAISVCGIKLGRVLSLLFLCLVFAIVHVSLRLLQTLQTTRTNQNIPMTSNDLSVHRSRDIRQLSYTAPELGEQRGRVSTVAKGFGFVGNKTSSCPAASLAINELLSSMKSSMYNYHLSRHASAYASRKPFPHAVVDDFFPEAVIKALQTEIPDNPGIERNTRCIKGSSTCIEDDIQKGKSGFRDEESFGPVTKAMFMYLRSSMFVEFLEKLTNVTEIVPDAHYEGSGMLYAECDTTLYCTWWY